MSQSSLIKRVKEKTEFSGILDSLVSEKINEVTKKYGLPKNKSEEKVIVSEVRNSLRKLSGRFQKSIKKRKKYSREEKYDELLATHSSTSERKDFYPELKKIIFSKGTKSILDLGCGLNPVALATKEVKYYACDIKQDELETIKSFFKKNKISGEVFTCDLRNESSFPPADTCLILKVFDIIGPNNHNITKKIISSLECSTIIVSFSTRKLSGKPMSSPERKWFEKILSELNLKYEKIYSENEVFYIIKKSSGKE